VEDQWVFAAILATLMLLAVGNIRNRAHEDALRGTLAKIASNSNDDGALHWYTVVHVSTVDANDLASVVDEVIDSLRGQTTMPRTDVFWRFRFAADSELATKPDSLTSR
jgi:hypothetical protein